MEKYIEKNLLENNCDAIEEVGYTRRFTPDELNQRKEELADVSIAISDIEAERGKRTRILSTAGSRTTSERRYYWSS